MSSIKIGEYIRQSEGNDSVILVLVDGRSGSGKTTFATALAQELGAAVIHMDDFYPGWDGLEAGINILCRDILVDSSSGYTTWDWQYDSEGPWVDVELKLRNARNPILIVEGVGAASDKVWARLAQLEAEQKSRFYHTFSYYLDIEGEERKRRALLRDPFYVNFWEMWAMQEECLEYTAIFGRNSM